MNIVIIGGSRGIGKAAARELLQDGNNVLIVGRNPKTLEETGKELEDTVAAIPVVGDRYNAEQQRQVGR